MIQAQDYRFQKLINVQYGSIHKSVILRLLFYVILLILTTSGFIISDGRSMLRVAWWICTFPGIAILITVLAINLVGEGLNDALNPRLRERN